VPESRDCEQCGTSFVPRREHARFCSAGCRMAWNQENTGGQAAELCALEWSITAMREATGRLARVRTWDPARAFGAVSDAVWWVTIVDATLVRYHADAYDQALACRAGERRRIEDTLAGLRFVRNQVSDTTTRLDLLHPQPGRPGGQDPGITAWTWNPVPQPARAARAPHGQSWELQRYRAYQAQLAGHSIGESFGRTTAFLKSAATSATTHPRTRSPASRH
jgi:hypothetical protein